MQDRNPVDQMYDRFNRTRITRDYTESPALNSKYVGLNFSSTPATGDRFYFRTDRQLKKLKGIKVYSATEISTVFIHGTSYTTCTTDQYADALLVLVNEKKQILAKLSLFSLASNVTNGKNTFLDMDVDWRNCYVQFVDTVGSVATTEAFVFQVWFE